MGFNGASFRVTMRQYRTDVDRLTPPMMAFEIIRFNRSQIFSVEPGNVESPPVRAWAELFTKYSSVWEQLPAMQKSKLSAQ
jgi:hypothetical protein